ncbi:MAG: alanyl-tRNA editing protein [Candidatus Bathyarchaeia archaeon]
MTERVFLEEPYTKQIVSRVVRLREDRVFLDRTIFYPESGGVRGDTGYIKNCRVVDTQVEENDIAHILDTKPILRVEQLVECSIDWDRRYRLMRMHTSAHLLFNVCQMLLDSRIRATSSDVGVDKARIDLDYEPTITPEIRQRLEDKCNELISKKLAVKCWYDQERPDYRLTQIDDLSKLPCGGLHVKNIEEIGTLRIIKRRSKGRGRQRLEFTVEEPS